MTYKIITEGEWPHQHSKPELGTVPPGTIIECDCGRQFILKHVTSSHYPEWVVYPAAHAPRSTEER